MSIKVITTDMIFQANTVRYDETELCLQNMTTVIEYDV